MTAYNCAEIIQQLIGNRRRHQSNTCSAVACQHPAGVVRDVRASLVVASCGTHFLIMFGAMSRLQSARRGMRRHIKNSSDWIFCSNPHAVPQSSDQATCSHSIMSQLISISQPLMTAVMSSWELPRSFQPSLSISRASTGELVWTSR